MVLELAFNRVKGNPDEYMKMIEMKAAGIEADMFLGALFGEGTEVECEILAKLRENSWEILATLRDDLMRNLRY